MTALTFRPISSPLLRPPPGPWSHAIEVQPGARFVYTCGLVGTQADGTIEQGIEAQTKRIYDNLVILLQAAGMTMADVIKINTYMLDLSEQPAYARVRNPYLGDARPAMTLLGVAQLAQRDLRVEVEVIAAKRDVTE
ncbi:RidA family protein [Paraburkholderia caballeronis]|uniref:2-iminobutanoate/2-iminopropanoate deaminase n=1 Tax=Paraburkholderia caballeronis TaxID=416943 RepID=A0A1H7T0K9_9BURK|nr:RidA family protein [Paraburkholderia caballeronis]PXW25759.1 2-iminobutanoate/2-iminopropanoate deaminase [Paraburkholderia caballeronis]PXX01366.1 2-iminobutanoate/2-iminopropanoate deaminase [Paraburkholderia caballeronis]RAJ99280.1 2-iminobutanoate/2-iminopropanoate deaminase [Paraburkholderia caballeronis]SEE23648.1 2-iminobutanoate/2-iminopropanoate deaminase [Paraburkholderia caballeronis]SEL78019.1 2-iminobutanoate/2-iminopropanoate deaminase [Paraburkholderia caballeronis]